MNDKYSFKLSQEDYDYVYTVNGQEIKREPQTIKNILEGGECMEFMFPPIKGSVLSFRLYANKVESLLNGKIYDTSIYDTSSVGLSPIEFLDFDITEELSL